MPVRASRSARAERVAESRATGRSPSRGAARCVTIDKNTNRSTMSGHALEGVCTIASGTTRNFTFVVNVHRVSVTGSHRRPWGRSRLRAARPRDAVGWLSAARCPA